MKNSRFVLFMLLFISIGFNLYFYYKIKISDNLSLSEINNINDNIHNFSGYSYYKLFLSLKNKDFNIWNEYWKDKYIDKNHEKYMKDIFQVIIDNKLELDLKNSNLLDGGIFLSNSSLDEKNKGCTMFFRGLGKDYQRDEKDKNSCINFSYIYEAIIKSDYSICNNINFDEEKKFCLFLGK